MWSAAVSTVSGSPSNRRRRFGLGLGDKMVVILPARY